jgi:hypothetical protein
MNRDEFIKKLHPSITHINASDNMSEETLEAINIMVEKVSKMTTEEIKNMVAENKKPSEVKEAQKYIQECEKDMNFMGSPKYYEAKKIVDGYYSALAGN